jgi:hypothetical protein
MKRISACAFAFAFGLTWAPFATKAEMNAVEVLFVQADRNGDLVLSKAEVLLVAVQDFTASDSDRDDLLEKQEVGDIAKDSEFSDNDADKDGALSIEEVVTEKLADFKAADSDKNGSLSVDEVKAFYGKMQ